MPIVDDDPSYAFLCKKDAQSRHTNWGQYEAQLESLDWQQELSSRAGKLTRYTTWLVSGGCQCKYEYGNKKHGCSEFPAWLTELTNTVANVLGVEPSLLNSVCGNKYVVEQHDLFWHSDKERYFRESETQRDTFIVSLSFGASRMFEFRKKQGQDSIPVLLEEGDLLVMLSRIQDFYQHRLCPGGVSANTSNSRSSSSAGTSCSSTRYNLTWRFFQRHDASCPLASEAN